LWSLIKLSVCPSLVIRRMILLSYDVLVDSSRENFVVSVRSLLLVRASGDLNQLLSWSSPIACVVVWPSCIG